VKAIATTLTHRVMMPETGGSAPHPALILLHGRGADEDDLVGITQDLDERLLVLSARAPFPFPYGGFTWYDAGADGTPDPLHFAESCNRLSAFIDDVLRSYPVDADRLFLLGFSMGAVMSLVAGLTRPEKFRGVSANSGYLPEHAGVHYRWDALASLNIFLAHGTQDPVVPVELARRAKDLLTDTCPLLRYREYPVGHELGPQSVADIAAWMGLLL